jgi:hypothetical protein
MGDEDHCARQTLLINLTLDELLDAGEADVSGTRGLWSDGGCRMVSHRHRERTAGGRRSSDDGDGGQEE